MSVLYKLYSACLSDMAGLRSIAMEENQFAFRPSYQATEVLFIIRQMTEKAREWGTGLYIMDGDLYKAYDGVEHSTWATGFDRAGVARPIAAAFIREVQKAESRVKLPGLPLSRRIRRTRSMYQGDPEAPISFNIVLDRMVVKRSTG